MPKYLSSILCLVLCLTISKNIFAQTITHPSQFQTGADFSHFSCTVFSEDSVIDDELIKHYNIKFREFGNGTFNEGSLLVTYGKNCNSLVKFKMASNSRRAKILAIKSSKNIACLSGASKINELFNNGFIFRQSMKNHARFSLELIGMNSTACDNDHIYLEFLRTR